LSHLIGFSILWWSSLNSIFRTSRSTMLCTAACFTYSTNFSIVDPSIVRHMVVCVCWKFFSFSWITREIWLSSSLHGWILAFKIDPLCCRSSTCACSSFPSYKHAKHCTGAKMSIVTLTSSYFCCASHISICSLCRFGSSYKLVHNSIALSKTWWQLVTAISNVYIWSLMVASHCSLTSDRVVGCSFNCSSEICIWKSTLTLPISSLDPRNQQPVSYSLLLLSHPLECVTLVLNYTLV